jgi:hypothetical protein
MYYFCTYFDQNYLIKGLALYASLKKHCQPFRLWILCMDRLSYDILAQLNYPEMQLISLEDFEKGDDELLQAKQNRSPIEYYFTCTPSLPLFIFARHPEVDLITYLDADLFFFHSCQSVFGEISDHAIAIIEHRYPAYLNDNGVNGKYNVGWLSFRRGEAGLTCLRWWRERCLEWCYDRPDAGRMADQKYLDDWPDRFPGVLVLQHKGANLAPWNIGGYWLYWRENMVYVEEDPLVFFHFHGFRQVNRWIYLANLAAFKIKLSEFIRTHIFRPYISALFDAKAEVALLMHKVHMGKSIRDPVKSSPGQQALYLGRKTYEIAKSMADNDYLLMLDPRVPG